MPDMYPPTQSDYGNDDTPMWLVVLLGLMMVVGVPAVVITLAIVY